MTTTQQLHVPVSDAPVSNTSHPHGMSEDTSEHTGAAPPRLLPERSSAWDPFEVWRTRVRPPSDPAHPGWEPRR